MAELIDIYTDGGDEHVGVADRNVAHRFGLWHKTAHCWIIKDNKSVVFQKRSVKLASDPGKLFSTSSGHVKAGETVADACVREIFEETGIKVAAPIEIFGRPYINDNALKNGREFHDHITWYLFVAKSDLPISEYKPQNEELDGFVELLISDVFRLANGEIEFIKAPALMRQADGGFQMTEIEVRENDFVLYDGETLANKFAASLKEVCEKLEQC